MKNKISAVCFDMWGTLTEGGGQKQWDDLQEILGAIHVDKKTFLKLGEENLLMHPWPLREGIRNLAARLELKIDNKTVEKSFKCWWNYVQRSKPYPEVESVLDKLKNLERSRETRTNTKIRLFIISNTDVEAFNFKIKKLGWQKYFEKFFLSAEIGVLKPHVKIFETVQKYISLPKTQILMVDDSLHHGVHPARHFGWQALWVARGKQSASRRKDEARIEDLSGIIEKLRK